MDFQQMDALPGAEAPSPELAGQLAAALSRRPAAWRPRTRHVRVDGAPRFVNRLAKETSPYLLQHAHNPVDWHPWGEEAFAKARALNRPVLLSVGYSTCHWCHVMEEESFEDEEVAAFLNAHYVPIKVDREQRPDVDAVYMACVQAWTGHGGWPMTVWLAPDKRPYYGGTYFPARDGERGARVGFLTLLSELARVYAEEPGRTEAAAKGIVEAIQGRLAGERSGGLPHEAVLDRAQTFYRDAFDPTHGGLASPPKFPSSLPIRFLLRRFRSRGGEALAMADLTLTQMARGGIYDHVGGGFHRYSVDATWLVPHFEKMLYDNALLSVAYLEGWQATGRQDFAVVAAETLDYVLRELTSPEGGFYSATDADSANPEKAGERDEGYYFTWTPDELTTILGPEMARDVIVAYGVTATGNFEGRSILHLPRPLGEVARDLGVDEATLAARLKAARLLLRDARGRRPAPLLDDKVLAGWNGLMISAMARGARVLHEPRFLTAALRAARFVTSSMMPSGRLLRCWKDGRAETTAFLEDYAFLVQGLLDLYEASFDLEFLKDALRLEGAAAARFEDQAEGGFFMTADDQETVLVREKPAYDGAVPSGNSVMAMNLLRLATLTGDGGYRERAERTLKAFHSTLTRAPWALSEMLLAVDFLLDKPRQIVLVTPTSLDEASPFLDRLDRTFLPNRVVAATVEADLPRASALIPLFRDKRADGQATAFVCEDTVCRRPVQDAAAFADELL